MRWITIGRSDLGRWLVVMHAERGSTMRIISARPASRRELP
ncbi:MAG TPA: BrnT family toxin [Candidatus Limnocylindria bacterium]